MDISQTLKYHLNPQHDIEFSRVEEFNRATDLGEQVKAMGYIMLSCVKSCVRGGTVGGIIGGGIAYMTDTDPAASALAGTLLGGNVDFMQFFLRYAYKRVTR